MMCTSRRLANSIFVVLWIGTQVFLAENVSYTQADDFLSWSVQHAEAIGKSTREKGRVGGMMGFRGLHTERAENYKLRATWLTPEVIRAAARLEQIRNRLSNDKVRSIVAEAEAAGDTVVMVEIDPREGSGVIPIEWQAFLQPKDLKESNHGAVPGVNTPKLRDLKALGGVVQRDYDYDVFWLVFPLVNDRGEPLFSEATKEAELIVRIYSKEGRVSWRVPDSIRDRARNLKRRT